MKIAIPLISLVILAFAAALIFTQTPVATGSGYIGGPAFIQSATTTTVGPDTRVTLFASAADCKSRVITTRGSAIRLSFGDAVGHSSTSLALSNGHVQAASTTVAYESGIYGCGLWAALGYSSTTIQTSNF